jgi:hypothetical protein
MDSTCHELSAAATVDEVLRVTRRYVRRVRREVPAQWRPPHVRGPRDIEVWADLLNEASRVLRPPSEEMTPIDRLALNFLIASVRVRQLGA